MPEASFPEPADDDLLHEWEAALESRLQVNVGTSSSSSPTPGVVRQQRRTSSATQPSEPGKEPVDEPLRSHIDPNNNRVMCQMSSGKTIALGSLSRLAF